MNYQKKKQNTNSVRKIKNKRKNIFTNKLKKKKLKQRT